MVNNNNHEPVEDAKVEGIWSFGVKGSCTTDSDGTCILESRGYKSKDISILSFTVTNIKDDSLSYAAQHNSDPDNDSDGTTISAVNNSTILNGSQMVMASELRSAVSGQEAESLVQPVIGNIYLPLMAQD